MKHPRPDLLMTLHITPNEVIALNVAINYYLKYCQPVSPYHKETCQLLDHYLQRLNAQVALPGPRDLFLSHRQR